MEKWEITVTSGFTTEIEPIIFTIVSERFAIIRKAHAELVKRGMNCNDVTIFSRRTP